MKTNVTMDSSTAFTLLVIGRGILTIAFVAIIWYLTLDIKTTISISILFAVFGIFSWILRSVFRTTLTSKKEDASLVGRTITLELTDETIVEGKLSHEPVGEDGFFALTDATVTRNGVTGEIVDILRVPYTGVFLFQVKNAHSLDRIDHK